MAVATEELRAMVREVLREALAARGAAAAGSAGAEAAPRPVRIACEAELQAFVAELARPGVIEAVRAGRLRFTLGPGQGAAPAPAAAAPSAGAVRLEGVISERRLQAVPKGATVALAPGAVLTPLARDMARRLGLRLDRRDA